MQKAYKLHGVHRHYDWGGTQFIPQLIQVNNAEQKPFAEYWMGAHASAPATIETAQGIASINTLGTIPFLFKVLDVAKMLSIQVHPSKTNAEIGFALEEKVGIALDAPHRNYKDQNHKPELMVALSDFWLLHGFLASELLEARLNEYPCFHPLLNHFKGEDYQALYSYFMQLSSEEADQFLIPLLTEAMESVQAGKVNKSHPHWWTHKYYKGVLPSNNIDKGIFSIYVLNIVHLKKYQGIFQGAGLLHAYLEGQNIELMANSDNVLRGGLTPKHIDISELLKNVQFTPTFPKVLMGASINNIETLYPCPVSDFGLSKLGLNQAEAYTINTDQLAMLLVIEGEVLIDKLLYRAGEVALVAAGAELEILAKQPSLLFKSFVP